MMSSWRWVKCVEFLFGFKVGIVRFLLAVKVPKSVILPIKSYPGSPLACAFDLSSSESTAFSRPVLLVESVSSLTQIVDPVISLHPVDVVYVSGGPSSMNVKPRQPVNFVFAPIYANLKIPLVVRAIQNLTSFALSTAKADSTGENACVWVVIKEFAQAFCAKIGLSHDAPYQRIGQKPRRVSSTSGLRHFNGLQAVCPV